MLQYGFDTTKKICEANLLPPKQTARVNTARITVEEAIEKLAEEGVDVVRGEVANEAIKAKKGNLANTAMFRDGYLTIQDESSMLVAAALNPSDDERVLDSCAAPGGKATHLAERMHGTGEVIALDIHDHKVKLIHEQAKRLKLENVTARALDSRHVRDYFAESSFDKILVDAPCSGFGVIRRKPEIKYAKTEADLPTLSSLQLDILMAAAPLLKAGGTLVYSTCTIDRDENDAVVDAFLQKHPEFVLDETLQERMPETARPYVKGGKLLLLPHHVDSDGFFIASLRKKG